MRNYLINLIKKNSRYKKNQFFLTADLGFSVLEDIKIKFGKRFINMGVSENNMCLTAVGLSQLNNNVYIYSISPFLILRSAEIIRNYISNEYRNIKMIGVGSGVSYSSMGKTHHNIDDINFIYSLKNITILNPANTEELSFVYNKFKNFNGPIYYRINKNNFKKQIGFKKINNFFIKKGKKYNLLCSGSILNYVLKLLDKQELNNFNIISIPIMNTKYNKNLGRYLIQGNTLCLTDSSKCIFFEDLNLNNLISRKYKITNYDLDHRKIKTVSSEQGILEQMGLKKKELFKNLL